MQDTKAEGAGKFAVLVPIAIAKFEILERLAHDATKHGANHAASQWPLRNAARPQIDVINGGIRLAVADESAVREGAGQVVPAASAWQAAELAEIVVRWYAMVAAALHVQGSQIRAEALQWLLE